MEYPEVGIAIRKGAKKGALVIPEATEFVFNQKGKKQFTEKYSEYCDVSFREMTEDEKINFRDFQNKPRGNPNRIVRVRIISHFKAGVTIEKKLMKFSEYIKEAEYKTYGRVVELHPYRWYELAYEVPYRLLFKNSLLNARKPIQIATKIAIVVVESIIGFYTIKFIIPIIQKFI